MPPFQTSKVTTLEQTRTYRDGQLCLFRGQVRAKHAGVQLVGQQREDDDDRLLLQLCRGGGARVGQTRIELVQALQQQLHALWGHGQHIKLFTAVVLIAVAE